MYISIPHSLFTFLFSLYVFFKHEICAVLLERQYQGNRKSLAVGIEMLHYSLLVDWLLNVPNTYFFVKIAIVKGQEVVVAVDINYHWNK